MLAGIIVIAVLLRAKLTFASDLLPGINGGYYPLMTKGLISSGSLPFQDAPLVFWIETLLSKFIYLFTGNHETAIILGCRIVDAALPPLAAIPIYLLALRKTKNHHFSLVVAAFLILFFPVSYLLTGDLHKNALALVWLSGFFSSIELFRSHPTVKKLVLPGVLLALMALTHFGTMAIGVLALPLLIIPLYRLKKITINTNALLLLLLIGARADRLAGIFINPFRLFEHPVLWYFFDGQQILTPYLIAFGLSILVLAILVFVNSVITKKGIYWALLAVFLSSPIIGIEWYMRLCIMAHIPLTLAIICQWKFSKTLFKRISISTLVLFTLPSVFLSFNGNRKDSISQNEVSDLMAISTEDFVSENDMIVCSHGMEWYTAWFLDCHIAQEQAITKSDFDNYDRIITLSRSENSGRLNRGQTNFANPSSGKNATVIFEGDHLVLKEASIDSYSFIDQDEKLISIGHISKNKKGAWQITNPLYTNPLIFKNINLENSINNQSPTTEYRKPNTEYRDPNTENRIPNTKYRVYGSKKPFSLSIKVSKIQAL